jgi:hypothetical protein
MFVRPDTKGRIIGIATVTFDISQSKAIPFTHQGDGGRLIAPAEVLHVQSNAAKLHHIHREFACAQVVEYVVAYDVSVSGWGG